MNIAGRNAPALVAARMRKLKNALTAILCGAIPATILGTLFHTPPVHWLIGFVVGLVWANAFEYFLHRFLLHWGQGFLVQRHALHHDSAGAPDEARYVNFATSPLVVLFVFLMNAPVVAAGELIELVEDAQQNGR